ncbi:MAG: hypothetical protein WDA27_15385 [Actinomycetota bacterium]
MNANTTTKATETNHAGNGRLMAIDLIHHMAPEIDMHEDSIAACRSMLAKQGYYLALTPKLRAVRGRDPEGNPTESL